MSTRIRDLIEEFAANLEAELKRELREALDGVGFGATSSHQNTPRSGGKKAVYEKRDPARLATLANRFVEFVAKHPGLRIEQINKELGTKTKELALPIRKLIEDRKITTKGQKRSTTYSLSSSREVKRKRRTAN